MNTNKVSIIVPVYNVYKYLGECIESVMKQTYKNIEILLIDDGSTDGSGRLCDEYASKDNRIKIYHIPNNGVSHARNYGIEKSTGQWIVFLDSDDTIQEEAVEKLLMAAINKAADIVICNAYYWYKDEKVALPHSSENDQSVSALDMLRSIYATDSEYPLAGFPWGKIQSKQCIEEKGYRFIENIHPSEDGIFYLDVYNDEKVRIEYINEYLWNYRQRQGSAVHNMKNKVSNQSKAIIEIDKRVSVIGDELLHRQIINMKKGWLILYIYYLCLNEKKLKAEELTDLLEDEIYTEAIYDDVHTKKEKIIFGLLKRHRYFLLTIVSRIINALNKARKKNKNMLFD